MLHATQPPELQQRCGIKRKAEDEDSECGSTDEDVAHKNKQCRVSKAKWTSEEDERLTRAVLVNGENWKKVAQVLEDRSHLQCLHRWQKVLNPALVKGPWREEEDQKLLELVEKQGPKDWSMIATHIQGRIGKQCRERWFNHLSPDVRKVNWTPEEDRIIIDAHHRLGNKWTAISKLLDGRPANAIKNHWNSTLLKRIQEEGNYDAHITRSAADRTSGPSSLMSAAPLFKATLATDDEDEEEVSCSEASSYQSSPDLSSSPIPSAAQFSINSAAMQNLHHQISHQQQIQRLQFQLEQQQMLQRQIQEQIQHRQHQMMINPYTEQTLAWEWQNRGMMQNSVPIRAVAPHPQFSNEYRVPIFVSGAPPMMSLDSAVPHYTLGSSAGSPMLSSHVSSLGSSAEDLVYTPERPTSTGQYEYGMFPFQLDA